MEIIDNLIQAFQQTSWLERISVLCGIIQVLLSKNNKSSNYLFGIAGILTGMYVLFGAKLYADISLNMYYLVMSIYGYWYWKRKKQTNETPISSCTRKEWMQVLGIVLLAFVLLFGVLTLFTDSDVPLWDAGVSATAWAGMWLLAKRKLENWILLNISNFFAVPLLIYKDLYLFAALTTFLFIVAIFGYLKWKTILSSQYHKTS